MHYKAFALFPAAEAKSSRQARRYVYDKLSEGPGFVLRTEGSKVYDREPHICDWFQIGGRWSGTLYPNHVRLEFFHQVDQLLPNAAEVEYYTDEFISANRRKIEHIWKQVGGKYRSPLTRDSSYPYGEKDDACILTQQLAYDLEEKDQILAREGNLFYRKDWPDVLLIYIFGEPHRTTGKSLYDAMIGNYWIVLIDYHK